MRVMIRTLGSVFLLLAATGGSALDCAPPPNPMEVAASLRTAPTSQVMIHGRLSFDEALLPQLPLSRFERWFRGSGRLVMTPVPAFFEGNRFDPKGREPFSAPIILLPTCSGDYCGYLTEGVHLLVANETTEGLTLDLDVCTGTILVDPDLATVDALAVCIVGGPCEPASRDSRG